MKAIVKKERQEMFRAFLCSECKAKFPHLSWRQLAKLFHLSPSYLLGIISGKYPPPSRAVLINIAKSLGVDEFVMLRFAGHEDLPEREDYSDETKIAFLAQKCTEEILSKRFTEALLTAAKAYYQNIFKTGRDKNENVMHDYPECLDEHINNIIGVFISTYISNNSGIDTHSNIYTTDDSSLATYLLAHGNKIEEVVHHDNKPVFIFTQVKMIDEQVKNYYNDKALEVKSLLMAQNEIDRMRKINE